MDYLENNRHLWDNKVDVHYGSDFYRMDEFRAGKSVLDEIATRGVGDVSGKRILHLQCHFGLDSMSLLRLGAESVVGVDFSPKAIQRARELAQEFDLNATFVESDVYSLPDLLAESFDLVFSTFGAIPWLPDLDRWAEVVARYVRPGGTFYMAEFHPTFYLFDFDRQRIEYQYFHQGYVETSTGTYADRTANLRETQHFWTHSLAETLQPLLNRGLQLETFTEYDWSPFNAFPNMHERAPGRFVLRPAGEVRLPHVFEAKFNRPIR